MDATSIIINPNFHNATMKLCLLDYMSITTNSLVYTATENALIDSGALDLTFITTKTNFYNKAHILDAMSIPTDSLT